MRASYAFPLLAALALVACNKDDPATDGELNASDVDAAIADNGVMPQPGEYTTSETLVELDAPGMTEESIAAMRAAFNDGAQDPHLFCVTEETTRDQWLSDMTEANCSFSSLQADGDELTGVMSCTSEESFNGRVELGGITREAGSNLTMTYVFPTQAGEGTVRLQVVSEKIGDCGA